MSRWGGFRKGRRRYTNNWNELKSSSSFREETVADTPQEFSYVDSKGIWNLRSTMEFPKSNAVLTQAPSYQLGLSDPTSYNYSKGQYYSTSYNMSSYVGATVRAVWKFSNPLASFRQDVQLDNVNIGSSTFGFESGNDGFETSSGTSSSYQSVSWTSVGTSATGGRWVRLTGNTGSSGTGDLGASSGSYYLYTESSSPGNSTGYNFWLRSPQVTISTSNPITFDIGLSTTDATNLTFEFYLDVIS
jgi:hypothetical protein